MASLLTVDDDPDKNSAKVLKAQWQRYKDLYTPVEDNLIDSLDTDMTQSAVAEAKAGNERAEGVSDRMRQRYGMAEIAPVESDRSQAITNSLAVNSAYNNTALAQVDRRDSVRQSLVSTGQSILNQATGGLADATSMQSSREMANANAEAQQEQAEDAQTASMVGTATMLAMMAF